jgi:hypothetical protein
LEPRIGVAIAQFLKCGIRINAHISHANIKILAQKTELSPQEQTKFDLPVFFNLTTKQES